MNPRNLHDGRQDGLVPLKSLALQDIHDFGDLVRAMSDTAFGGRSLGQAYEILLEMSRRQECSVVLTVSGAMTVAKQGRIVCDMIDRGIVDVIVATGALIAHGLTESIGLTHYRYDATKSDEQLFEQGYNRIFDTLEMEENLNDVEKLVRSILNDSQPEDGVWSSARFCRAMGQRLADRGKEPGILKSAFEQNIPVYIPAFTDSEMGLDFATWAMSQSMPKDETVASLSAERVFCAPPQFNPFLDLVDYAKRIATFKEIGIFTIGGGVPRNWAQQIAPFFEITNDRLGTHLPVPRFKYGVRICPEPVDWGGLSGCTYSEGVSWGKFVPPSEGGRFAEVFADATLVWPLLMKAVFDDLDSDLTEM